MGSMDDRWRIIFNEHARAPIYTVSHYIAYLRRFVADTAKDRKDKSGRNSPPNRKSATDGIDPLSYFLRKLKLDLKASYDSFVNDFVRPQNAGLGLLLRLLTNLQSFTAGQLNKSSSSLNKSTSKLDDYKKSVTDEHDCLLCIKFCLRVQSAVRQLVENADGLQRMATGVQGSSSKARITCLEILTLCLLDAKGVDAVVEAFTVLRLQTGQTVRFKMLVSMLHTRSPSQVLFQVTCLKLFNTLLNACSSANQRVYLQHELLSAGLDMQFLKQCAEGDGLEYDDLRREIHEWSIRFIDVDILLKRLKGGRKDSRLAVPFSDQEGPLQVSSRKGSMRSGLGVTYFQPEELAGTVQLGSEFRGSNPHLTRNQHDSNNDGFVRSWQPVAPRGFPNYNDNQQVNGVADDDSDSEFLSVSAQPTPLIHRKHPQPSAAQSGQVNSRRNLHRESGHNTASPTTPGLHRDAVIRSNHDFCAPPAYQPNGFSNGYGHRWEPKEDILPERRPSRESIVDAYGLVIHGSDRRGGHDPGGVSQSYEGLHQSVYSNWKLQYYSSPNVPRTVENGSSDKHGPQGTKGEPHIVVTSSPDAVKNSHDNGSVPEDGPVNGNGIHAVWNSHYLFSKRALYLGHETGSVVDKGDATLPLRGINSPVTYGDEIDTSKIRNEKFLRIPEPDYTPLPTPRSSTRSLNTEVARVLRDFENTLRAHEPSRPSSVVELGPIAFV